jgi:parallel beta-helix repeat protein
MPVTLRHPGTHLLGATIIGLVLIVSGCTAAQSPDGQSPDSQSPDAQSAAPLPPGAPPPSSQAGPLPTGCTSTVTEPAQAASVLVELRPGNTMCLSGDRLAGAQLAVTTSGTATQPITIVANGATMQGINVKADYVVIQGVTLKDGDGLTMEGRGLVARNNVVYNATMDGIACVTCVDTTIESNTVARSDGTGIWFSGERVTVRNNTVSESILRTGGDADGIRFFGTGHRLTGNTIKDIKASGYGDDPRGGPHTDCFQTFNTASNPPTYDVVIADNVCTNVDVQCLIATANERGAQGTPAGQTAITFERNTCAVNGSQAVLLENFPRVIVRGNHFSGPGSRAVQLNRGSTDSAVIDNTVAGRMLPYQIDQQSRPGFQESGNTGS